MESLLVDSNRCIHPAVNCWSESAQTHSLTHSHTHTLTNRSIGRVIPVGQCCHIFLLVQFNRFNARGCRTLWRPLTPTTKSSRKSSNSTQQLLMKCIYSISFYHYQVLISHCLCLFVVHSVCLWVRTKPVLFMNLHIPITFFLHFFITLLLLLIFSIHIRLRLEFQISNV